jgi:hypothetical protein
MNHFTQNASLMEKPAAPSPRHNERRAAWRIKNASAGAAMQASYFTEHKWIGSKN